MLNSKNFSIILYHAVRKRVLRLAHSLYKKRSPKIFCIGQNKTGTTSIKVAFEELGFFVGNQRQAEKLNKEYFKGNFDAIIRYCHSARVFQDVPFSWPETYKHLDRAFPDAKFILTIRDSPEQWYNSLLQFHTKRTGHKPTKEDFIKSKYVRKGWQWESFGPFTNKDSEDIWDKEWHTTRYQNHNNAIIEYFSDRPEKLLVINVSHKDSYKRFCDFIGQEAKRAEFPWENKTQ